MSNVPSPILWQDEKLKLLDQRMIPHQERYLECSTVEDVFSGIRDMVVRGAPCIGFTALYGLCLWMQKNKDFKRDEFYRICDYLKKARPTAVNLMFEIDRACSLVSKMFGDNVDSRPVYEFLLSHAHSQLEQSWQRNTKMAEFASVDLGEKFGTKKLNLMTHCNTGYLACGTLGTALGVISYYHNKGKVNMVYADETRPYLQGSRLTAYELTKEGIPYRIVVEGAASYLMKNKLIDAIFVGADRIAANGDTANKVGTSTLAIVAKRYGIPFYVVAPLSSFDKELNNGNGIEIELRDDSEITFYKEQRIAPINAKTLNPSFDVTDADLITAIICEKAIIHNPSIDNMKILWSNE
jgi:methylthioribose-1-phosphate isomerase